VLQADDLPHDHPLAPGIVVTNADSEYYADREHRQENTGTGNING